MRLGEPQIDGEGGVVEPDPVAGNVGRADVDTEGLQRNSGLHQGVRRIGANAVLQHVLQQSQSSIFFKRSLRSKDSSRIQRTSSGSKCCLSHAPSFPSRVSLCVPREPSLPEV